MEMYNFSGFGNAENYMIQGAETDFQLTSPLPEQTETMYNEGPAPEFMVDPGMYYPAASNYGFYCTGFEAPGEWEDQNRIFGVHAPDAQYPGAQSESLSYVYYTPTYGYAQSQYNPYNPYIHGAVIGPEGPYVGSQQYYTIPPYQSSVSSSPYVPVVVQPDIIPNSSPDTFIDPSSNRSNGNGRGTKYATSGSFYRNPSKTASNQTSSLARISERARANVGPSNQSAMHGSISAGSFPGSASSHVFQGRSRSGSNQSADKIANGKVVPQQSQMKVAPPINSGITEFGASAHEHNEVGKFRPKIHVGRALNDANVNSDSLGEQNRGPRINRSKNQLAVKAYTTKAGDSNAEGNIIIYTDQYNKDDFPLDYEDAKFFVIKSYSEDDVHKSIKYNVWSSTPHGNKKLNSAYEDAKRISVAKSRGCPIFLFFSVNASGQFCGVAEMIGPVDFNKDMDFWQQDKWSGTFPVKWHIIKDIQNVNFRHILLENNENKPVTNSRDTQEITYKKGVEMLKTFKSHTLKTSLLDDFIYYENRQKIMQDEKTRSLTKRFETPYFLPALAHATRQLNTVAELSQSEDRKVNKVNDDLSSSKRSLPSTNSDAIDITTPKGDSEKVAIEMKDDLTSTMKIGSLSINPKQEAGLKLSPVSTNSKSTEVVTVGSVSIKVPGGTESSSILTVGTIPLDPRALQVNKEDAVKNGFPRK